MSIYFKWESSLRTKVVVLGTTAARPSYRIQILIAHAKNSKSFSSHVESNEKARDPFGGVRPTPPWDRRHSQLLWDGQSCHLPKVRLLCELKKPVNLECTTASQWTYWNIELSICINSLVTFGLLGEEWCSVLNKRLSTNRFVFIRMFCMESWRVVEYVCVFFGWRRFESGTYLYVHIAQWCHRNNAGWWCKKLQHPPALTDDCNFANWTFLQVYEWKRLKSLIYNSCYAECRASNKFVHISSGRRKEKLQKNGVYLQWMEWGCGEKRKKMCVRVFWVPQNRI